MRSIRRTELLRQLKDRLKEERVIILSGYFMSGKTMLLRQLAEDSPHCGWVDCAGDAAPALPDPLPPLLVIDHLHRADDRWLADTLAPCLRALPPSVSVVMAGRAKLPPPLRPLYASGLLQVMDVRFLAFQPEEIRQFFLEYQISICPADVRFLAEAGNGWALILSLVARRMQQDAAATPMSLRNEITREVRALLRQDVLSALPTEDQRLLTLLAPFADFSDGLARAVTDRKDAADRLIYLADTSYFLMHLPPNRFHFSSLVRAALMEELQNTRTADQIAELYRRAAAFYEREGRFHLALDAFEHAGATEDFRRLLLIASEQPTCPDPALLSNLRRLTDEATASAPSLLRMRSLLCSLCGKPQESERLLNTLMQKSAEDARQLSVSLPHRGAEEVLQALRLHPSADFVPTLPLGMPGIRDSCAWIEHENELTALLRQKNSSHADACAALLHAAIAWETSAEEDGSRAMERFCLASQSLPPQSLLRLTVAWYQSKVLTATGAAAQGIDLLQKTLHSLPKLAPDWISAVLMSELLSLRMATGESLRSDELPPLPAQDGEAFRVTDHAPALLRLRFCLRNGQLSEIPLLAGQLRAYADRYHQPRLRIQLNLLDALLLRQKGTDHWRVPLEAALTEAERLGLTRVIADEGALILPLLQAQGGERSEWLQTVLKLTRRQAILYPLPHRQGDARPQLTEREEEVYRLLIVGCRNAQIASMLNITERTVKHHCAQIFSKFGVSSRAEVIAEAAALGDL